MEKEILDILKSMQNDMKSMRSDMNTMQNDINTMRSDMNTMQNDINTMRNDMNTMQNDINTMRNDINTMENDIKLMGSDINIMQNDITTMKITQEEHTQLLRALEHKTDIIAAEQQNLKYEVAEVNGEVKNIRKDLSNIEMITASNWSDIAKLKAIK